MPQVLDYRGSHTPENIRDLWQTPRWLYNAMNSRFHFECDIAASSQNHLHPRYIDESQNAFTANMREFSYGSVWCNPPYSDITPWIELAITNRNDHNITTVMLIPADTSVGWFKLCTEQASQIMYITGGRISFVRADTLRTVSGNTKGSMLVVFEPHTSELVTTYLDRNTLITEGTV